MKLNAGHVAIALAVFALAAVAALVLLRGEGGGSPGGGDSAVTSEIWSAGDGWTVTVEQDAGAITPDGASSVASVPFRFEVPEAPAAQDEPWIVEVRQDGAEGPFAEGWRLQYLERDGAMVLSKVAVAGEQPVDADLASVVLGVGFPLTDRYEQPPRDATVSGTDLLADSALPPAALPDGGGTDGARPPRDAPELPAGATPPTTEG